MTEMRDINLMQSDALTRNLDLTRVEVIIPEFSEILKEAVRGYAGKEQQAKELLREYHHQYRNWQFVVQETWRYATSNLRLYGHHQLNGSVVFLLSQILFEALRRSDRSQVRSLAIDYLIGFWLKLTDEIPEEIARPIPEGILLKNIEQSVRTVALLHEGILHYFFRQLRDLRETPFESLMKCYYQPKRLAAKLINVWSNPSSFEELRGLMERLQKETYQFWLLRDDPCKWAMQQEQELCVSRPWSHLCYPLSHEHYLSYLRVVETEVEPEPDHRKAVSRLTELPDFSEIVRLYFKLPEELKAYEDPSQPTHLSTLMRFKIMETRGLEGIHEETLREINFEVGKWIKEESIESLEVLIGKILDVLEGCLQNYPEAALQILRTIGLEVAQTENKALIEFFLKRIIRMGFQTPQLGSVTQHWQIEMNPAHLPNIRVWLDIINKHPSRTKSLLSALIVNLALGGIYIRDTDLFQRDVSQLLHAPTRPAYNLVKQLAKLFPVYFNQIGAEGQLRTVSTDVDELTGRDDRLVHFLRKQSHVESNNVIVSFVEAIIEFWRTLDKIRLEDLVPPEVFAEISDSGPLVEEMHSIFEALFNSQNIHHTEDLLDLSESEIQGLIQSIPDVSDRERQRAFLMIQFYQLVHEKYALSFKDIQGHLQRASTLGLPDPTALIEGLDSPDPFQKLESILDYLIELKEVILTPCDLQVLENIYYKRHIAVDIPSMYGSYNERKFDALGLTFRLENLANVLFEEIIFSFNLTFITRASFFRISKFLHLFIKALDVDGIASYRLARQEELFQKALKVPRFSHSQYMDIFRGFSEAIRQIIRTNYYALHQDNLETLVGSLGQERLLPRYRRESDRESLAEWNHRVSESFLRELIARTFGLQYFDHFIGSILTTLDTQREMLSVDKLDLLLSYDPEKTISLIHKPNKMTYDLIHMGNKAYTLTKLHSIGIRVPPAFVITTEYFRCRSVIEGFSHSHVDLQERVMEHIRKLEEATGRHFGCPDTPLLLSVRSGSAMSMPGMMNTFLNVGINEAVVEGLIKETREAWFAWDNYRRFIQSWAMSFGMQRDEFDALMVAFKKKYGRTVKRHFQPAEMRELALAYKEAAFKEHGIVVAEDPKEQLFTAINQVTDSWITPKAKTYREIMGISENWGTAVTIQAMVFGNLDTHSGAGVMFTHDPWRSEDQVDPVGDFTLGNQGEDVVGGLVERLPLSEKQRLGERDRKEHSLERLFPKVYHRLVKIAKDLIYGQNWAPQEIEFTFQGDGEEGVFVLQSRNMTARTRRHYPVFKPSDALNGAYLGSGIGVSGGALCGVVAFDLESIQHLREHRVPHPVILIRADTVPDDIREISIADGILTGKGGATSHAAIVANRLEKICVVGFSKIRVWERERKCVIDGRIIRTGDMIGIDGRSGAIYFGYHETEEVDKVMQDRLVKRREHGRARESAPEEVRN
jgi:pyruvate, orthophosphate dikinase